MINCSKLLFTVAVFAWVFASCGDRASVNNTSEEKDTAVPEKAEKTDDKLSKEQRKLLDAYPDFIQSFENNRVVFKSGEAIVYDDGKEKSFDELLNSPDVEDMFKYEYPHEFSQPGKNQDPGRIRNEAFFKNIYGTNRKEVYNNLVSISWLPGKEDKKIKFNKLNGAADSLQKVSDELAKLSHLHKYLKGIGGTFNWRTISGTDRLSAHSFAVSIDISVKYSNYWKWDEQAGRGIKYKNKIPLEIVQIFEKYGFIWGGKWYHYDTMHFEFRPELL